MSILQSRNYKKYYEHLLRRPYFYLPALWFLLAGTLYLVRYARGQPLLLGPESYFHLSSFTALGGIASFPLGVAAESLPGRWIILLPLFLSLGSLLLFTFILFRMSLEKEAKFFFLFFLLLTPAFLYAAVTISSPMLTLFLLLSGGALLTFPRARYLAALPLVLLPFIDILSGIMALLLLIIYHYYHQRERWILVLGALMVISLIGSGLLVGKPLVLGPFHEQSITADLVSDFGGMGGIGITLLLLSVIGMRYAWQRKKYRWWYILLLVLLPFYIYSTQIILQLTVVLLLFAAVGFVRIFSRGWSQKTLKLFTLLVILLSVCFSTVSYLQRMEKAGPAAADIAAWTWIKEQVPQEKTIVALPQYNYYIQYFAEHQAVLGWSEAPDATVLNSSYIATTFPIFEEQQVGAVYVTPEFKARYPADQGGLLFLLKNERFKLRYSSEGYEVWVFE